MFSQFIGIDASDYYTAIAMILGIIYIVYVALYPTLIKPALHEDNATQYKKVSKRIYLTLMALIIILNVIIPLIVLPVTIGSMIRYALILIVCMTYPAIRTRQIEREFKDKYK